MYYKNANTKFENDDEYYAAALKNNVYLTLSTLRELKEYEDDINLYIMYALQHNSLLKEYKTVTQRYVCIHYANHLNCIRSCENCINVDSYLHL